MNSLCAFVKNVFNPFFKGLKIFFKGKIDYDRFISYFRSFYNKCGFQYIVRNVRYVFSFVSISVVFFVWVSFRPLVLMGELSQTDRNFLGDNFNVLTDYLSNIDFNTELTYGEVNELQKKVNNFHTDNNSHLGQLIRLGISEGTTLTNIVSRLDTIITALENLDNDDSSGAGGEGSSSELLTEATFVDKYDAFSTAFGFGGSAGSLYTLLNTQAQNIEKIHQGLGYSFYGNGDLKYDVGQVITALNTANTSLNSIISELEDLNSKDFGGGGSSSTTINQDWLKEATFTQKYDLLLNALGFGSGSNLSGSLNDILTVLNDIKNKDFSGGGTDVSSITQDWLKEATFTEKWQTFSNGFGYSGGSSGSSLINDIKSIITALETIDTTLKTNTGGSISTEDLLQESTFVEKFNNFQSSFGFSGGSSGSLKDALNSWKKPEKFSGLGYYYFLSEDGNSPFPGNSYPWYTSLEGSTFNGTWGSPWEYMVSQILDAYAEGWFGVAGNLKKQAWNDWQAHTNTVATLYNIFSMENDSKLEYDEETGIVTIDTGRENSSSGNEKYSIIPVTTNTVETAVVAVTNTTDRLSTIYVEEQVRTRYLNDALLSVGKNYGIGDSEGSSSSAIWQTSWFIIDFSSWSASYRQFMSIELLSKARSAMAYLWTLVSAICCILLVRQWGNM